MAKRYRKKTLGRRRVKRYRKKKRAMKRQLGYDPTVTKVKAHSYGNFNNDALAGSQEGNLVIDWACNTTITASRGFVVQPNQFPELTQAAARFREWRMVGVKIQWWPMTQQQTVDVNQNVYRGYFQLTRVHSVGTAVDGATASSVLLNNATLKMRPASRYYKCYVNIGRFYAKKGYKWIPTNSSYPQNSGSTTIKVETYGYNANTTVGRYMVTYYAQFRGQISG